MERLRTRSIACGAALLLAVTLVGGGAEAAQVMACKLTIDDGQAVKPPSDLILRLSATELNDWTETGWGRNQCGPHGGIAPDVICEIHDGHFQADFLWQSNIGLLERHVVLNLTSGEFSERDHNGLEKKGICRPAPEPELHPAPHP
jgi:hypothetical protein